MIALSASISATIDWALALLLILIVLQSFGLPLPGVAALVACGVLADEGGP